MLEKKILKNHALALSLFAFIMLGMSFAAVPLYKLFCQVTGYGGTPLISKEKKNGNYFDSANYINGCGFNRCRY